MILFYVLMESSGASSIPKEPKLGEVLTRSELVEKWSKSSWCQHFLSHLKTLLSEWPPFKRDKSKNNSMSCRTLRIHFLSRDQWSSLGPVLWHCIYTSSLSLYISSGHHTWAVTNLGCKPWIIFILQQLLLAGWYLNNSCH